MSYKIKVINLTNSSLARYGKGDKLKFSIEPKIEKGMIKRMKWKFSDGYESNEMSPEHIFVSKGTTNPGEGIAKIKVRIIMKKTNPYRRNDEIIKIKRRICVAPNINCDIQIGLVNPMTETSNLVAIEAQAVCEMIVVGSPINGRKNYACGGACDDTCPRCEVISIGIKPKPIIEVRKYGRYDFWTKFKMRCKKDDNMECIDLYRENIIGKKSQYKTLRRSYNLCPNGEQLYVTPNNVAEKVERIYKIRNLSESLLPKKTEIRWVFNNPVTGIKEYKSHSSYVEHTIENGLPTTLNVTIKIPHCDVLQVNTIINN